MSTKMTTPAEARTRSKTSTSPSKAVADPAPKCYLIMIPPEIRDSILRQLLLLPERSEKPSVTVVHSRNMYFTLDWKGKTRLWNSGETLQIKLRALKVLTQTCKLLYFESVALFYASHCYHFDCANSCSKMLRSIGPGRRQHIKYLALTLEDVKGDNKHPGIAAALLAQCNLKRLKLFVNRNTVRTMFTHNLFRAAGVKKLREIRGCEEVRVEQLQFTHRESTTYFYGRQEVLFTEEQLKEFEAVLNEELCQAREQVREVVKEIVVEELDE